MLPTQTYMRRFNHSFEISFQMSNTQMIKDSTDPSSTKFTKIKEIPIVRACTTNHPCFQAAVPLYKTPAAAENKSTSYRSAIRPRSSLTFRSPYTTFMSLTEQSVNFYPVHKKGSNYLQYCIGWLEDDEKPRSKTECIYRYTSGSNWYCTEVNMALAADSSTLKTYGTYVKQLKYAIGMSPMTFTGTVFRGLYTF